MTFGQKKLTVAIKQGKTLTPEMVRELELLSKEIDVTYQKILDNQAAFNNIPLIVIDEEKEET